MAERVICRPYSGNFAGAHYEPDPEAPPLSEVVEVLREARSGCAAFDYETRFPVEKDPTVQRIDALIARLEGE